MSQAPANNSLRSTIERSWGGLTVAAALVCAALVLVDPLLPLAGLIGVVGGLALIYVPMAGSAFVFFGILLDALGSPGISIGPIPVTIAKLSVLVMMAVHLMRSVLKRTALVRYHPIHGSMLFVMMSMCLSMVASGQVAAAIVNVIAVAMLTVLIMLSEVLLSDEGFDGGARAMGALVALVVLWSLWSAGYAVNDGGNVDSAWNSRGAGTVADANEWATMLIMAVPFAVGMLSRDERPTSLILRAVLIGLYPIAIMQSFSRAGLLGMIATVPGLVLLNWRHRGWMALGGLVALAAMPFFINLDAVLLRYQTIINPELEEDLGYGSLSERGMLLEAGLLMFKNHPWMGVGVGMFPTYASYVTAGGVWKIAHNTYLNIAAEQGAVGVLLHAVGGMYVVRAMVRAVRFGTDERWRAAAGGVITGVLGYAVMALTLNLLEFGMLYFQLGVLVAADRRAVDEMNRKAQAAPVVEMVA